MFVIITTYLWPLEDIQPLLSGHFAWLDRHFQAGTFLLSGPRAPRTGSVTLVRASDRAAVEALVAEDALAQAGAARYDITEFSPGRAAAGFANLLS